ncbi:MAG: AraC family transcriptional regulator [Proteobacteria bacterium]|nr:AraC family transcriptional regulator [Pseudomonadota bacterium]
MAGSVVASTVFFARSQGMALEALVDVTGLDAAQLVDVDRRQPDDAVARIWTVMRRRDPSRAYPLEMAMAAPFSFLGALAHGAQFAASYRESLQELCRLRRLLADRLEAELVDHDRGSSLFLSHPTDTLDDGYGGLAGLVLGARYVRDVLGLEVQRLTLAHPIVGSPEAYDVLGVPCEFEADRSGLHFAPGALDLAPKAIDPTLNAFIRQHLEAAHARLPADDALADVREAIADNADNGRHDSVSLAKSMGVSLRVLQRRTADHDTTVKALIDEVRMADAQELLADRRLGVEEVGYLLGYSDERAFRRAFKRVTGKTPAAWRRA